MDHAKDGVFFGYEEDNHEEKPKKLSIEFKYFKETGYGSYEYTEIADDDRHPLIGVLHIRPNMLESIGVNKGENIKITVERK